MGANLERASFRKADFLSANLSSVHAGRANFSGARFRDAILRKGDFQRTTCLDDTYFHHANLQEADFTGAKLAGAELSEADLTRTRFDSADLTTANLGEAILNETSFLGANLRGAGLHGAFIRNVQTDSKTDQHSLSVDVHVAWNAPPGKGITFTEVDDIRLAQFHGIIEEHGSVANLISASAKRVVLILGRFLPRRKTVLNRLAEALRDRGKVPVIFDFPGPNNREVSDTVRFIAGMSQFVVVDMTKANSVPLELQATIPDLMIPVLPIIESGQTIFSMFSDLQRRYFWVQPPVSYKDAGQLVKHVDKAILERAEFAEAQIRERRAASVRRPMSVLRVNNGLIKSARRRKK